MGRHNEWRKIAKRERRRNIRTQLAKLRDNVISPSSTEYEHYLKEQEILEIFEIEQIEKINNEENEKWLKAESSAMKKWGELQEKLKQDHLQKLAKNAKIRQEWEEEQKKIKEAVERLKQIEEQNKKQEQLFIEKLEQFLSGDSKEPPRELLVGHETRPKCEPCPFFIKTGCCRFGDRCSRNHQYPGVSKTLIAVNFYTHFGLDNSHFNEYDTDVMLEYEDSDTHKDFKEFFYDVLPEFEKFGKILEFKVCNNYEKHLRGNTYIKYADLRSAVAAYRALHSRWYGGRQISLQFCEMVPFKNAICRLQSSKQCPKGRACNFMHVFRNPNNLFAESSSGSSYRKRTPPRSWRWSESPEVEEPSRRVSKRRKCESDKSRRQYSDKKKKSKHHRSRRKDSETNREKGER